jgi:hypothetical protein
MIGTLISWGDSYLKNFEDNIMRTKLKKHQIWMSILYRQLATKVDNNLC